MLMPLDLGEVEGRKGRIVTWGPKVFFALYPSEKAFHAVKYRGGGGKKKEEGE